MINVLIIDDDAMVAELNRRYVAQIPGFQCCGTASTLEKAKEIIFNSDTPIDLILLDIYMRTGSIYCLSCITRVAKVM
ncbi:transcriptional regulatory protein dcuR domain protein [Escherichia coli LT-68]|nr:transcriptional regulatory protein dcuR domain protein [Escherichia coli LT-68]